MKILRSQPNAVPAVAAAAVVSFMGHRTAVAPVAEPATITPRADARETTDTSGTLVIAVGGRSAREVCAMSMPLSRDGATAVHVLHVVERDTESGPSARELLNGCVAELRNAGVPVVGELLHSTGTHAAVAARILNPAAGPFRRFDAHPRTIALDTYPSGLAA
jgi:hypothetical protein